MHKRKELKTRILSALLSVAMVLSILPPVTLPVKAAETYTFSSGAVLLDESFSNSNVIIQNGVFSVTVSGAQNVNIIFDVEVPGVCTLPAETIRQAVENGVRKLNSGYYPVVEIDRHYMGAKN